MDLSDPTAYLTLFGTTPERLAVLAAVTAAAGVIRGFSGFGAGMVMAPTFGLILGPARAIPVLVMLEVAASLRLVPEAIAKARPRMLVPIALAAALTVPIGSRLLAMLDPRVTQKLISVLVLVAVLVLGIGWRYTRRPTLPAALATGAASGLMTGIGGIGGPPVVVLLLAGPDPADESRANLITYIAISQLIAIAAFAGNGLLDRSLVYLTLVLAPVFFLATHLGSKLFRYSTENVYRRVVLALLFAIGLVGLVFEPPGRESAPPTAGIEISERR